MAARTCRPCSPTGRRIAEISAEVWKKGRIPLAPQLILYQWLQGGFRADWKQAMDVCLAYLERCDMVGIYGSAITPGMALEIRAAERLGMIIENCLDRPAADQEKISRGKPSTSNRRE